MAWCPKCRNEYREGIKVCADCGQELVETLEDTPGMIPLYFGEEKDLLEIKEYLLKNNAITDADVRFDSEDSQYELLVEADSMDEAKKMLRVYFMDKLSKEAANTEEETTDKEDCDSCECNKSSVYVSSKAKAEDFSSSAWSLIIVGAVGLICLLLSVKGVINISLSNPVLFYSVLGIMFIAFIIAGISSMKRSKELGVKGEEEEKLIKDVTEFGHKELDKESLLKEAGESLKDGADSYFVKYELIKNELTKHFPEASESIIDHVIDTDLYDFLFEDMEDKNKEK
ncbi:MAG: hypothetical protein K6F84_09105 [Lachnospiraceae bacterium]|nr:hypothetical protein [Lachnospiraceae bacterium]